MKILYVVNTAAFFCSHRLPLAVAAREAGHDVMLLTGRPGSPDMDMSTFDQLRRHNIPHHEVAFTAGGIAPRNELLGLAQMIAFMLRWKPDLVHCVSPKGVLYGSLATRLTRRAALVLAVSGMGSLFTGDAGFFTRTARRAYLLLASIGYGHGNCRVIVQNRDDLQLLIDKGLTTREKTTIIPGSGVPLQDYCDTPWETREDLVVLPARLLREKGVLEFVEAARILRAAGSTWRFALVGAAGYDKPSAISRSEVQAWVDEGCIEWWGYRDDMVTVFAQARIVCLPSYREGMPKALLEAAAAGCAVITTDTVGCREAVLPGISGDLVPARSGAALARSLFRLIQDPERQIAYGSAGRHLAQDRFGLDAVISSTLACYQAVSSAHPSSGAVRN